MKSTFGVLLGLVVGATVSCGLSGTGVGQQLLSGAGVEQQLLSGTGVGQKLLSGTGVGQQLLSGSGVGQQLLSGTGVGQLLSGTGVGQVLSGSGAGQALTDTAEKLARKELVTKFGSSLYPFSAQFYKVTARYHNYHFVHSDYSVWLAMAAMAEGATGDDQKELLQAINMPDSDSVRREYYALAKTFEVPGDDVVLRRKRFLFVDDAVTLNSSWASEVRALGLLESVSLPLRADLQRALALVGLPTLPAGLPALEGNSLLADSLDFETVLTTAFADAYLERDVPFYDNGGQLLGSVDLMRFEKRVKLAHVPLLNLKAIEIPVGLNGRYRLLMTLNLGNTTIRDSVENLQPTIIADILDNIRESVIPLQVGIPVFSISSVFPDVRALLECTRTGVRRLWRDPASTARISTPPALPSAYVHRVSLRFGAAPAPGAARPLPGLQAVSELATGLAAVLGRDFIANRPFMYALVDAETRIHSFSGVFSLPDKPK